MSQLQPQNIFVFVLWEKARPAENRICADVRAHFHVLTDTEVTWPRGEFVERLAQFYDERNWWKWFKKAWRCGRGPMRILIVEDPHPVFTPRTPSGRALENRNVVKAKIRYRGWIPRKWAVHASSEPVETRRQIGLLTGMTIEQLITAWSKRAI